MQRRTVLTLAAAAGLLPLSRPRAADLGTLRLGVLKFGTVSWELDVIKTHGLDAKEGFSLDVQPFAGNDAADVGLMGGSVDAIVEDWLWVSRQRSDGVGLTFLPYSSSIGALMVRADGPSDLAGLKGRKIGVTGGLLDKNWILLLAYARDKLGIDLAREAEPVYGAPPLLSEKLTSGELDAVLIFWNYAARLEAQGCRSLLEGSAVQAAFGAPATTPQLGYVLKEETATAQPDLIRAFMRASRAAKGILRDSDAEWDRLKPVTRAESDAVQAAFMRRYRQGIVEHWGPPERAAAAGLYQVLAGIGGEKLVGKGATLADGTFWPGVSF